MPKRTDIHTILLVGAGPIVIGQACEFDYSGSQACKALKEEGYKVILVNSNPATIMTDPNLADSTYIEPITAEMIEKIIIKERPDAILPTLGGQTALNVTVELAEGGVLDKYSVEMIGANLHAIKMAEDRGLFKEAMTSIGLRVARSSVVHSLQDALESIDFVGLPTIIRPAFTLGGFGGSVASTKSEFELLVQKGLDASPISEVLIEESVMGWKEFELEVMRDKNDNVVIICSIENFDPMGIHTGDSITVAPAQTLTDKEYQQLRDYSIAIIRKIGVDTGGSNIQFAINPENGDVIVIEMNPRVSRSSALASKATGFPIAKIAAKLAVGYYLNELPNDITRQTKASFEPTIDYVVTKIPRFNFEKFPRALPNLTVQMKSVGETMAIGRTFKESFQKACRGLEIKKDGWTGVLLDDHDDPDLMGAEEKNQLLDTIRTNFKNKNYMSVFYLKDALRLGIDVETLYEMTKIDRWFLWNLFNILSLEKQLKVSLHDIGKDLFTLAKQYGFSDAQLARLSKNSIEAVIAKRESFKIRPTYKLVDTCAAEFQAYTPYYYSTYEDENESIPSSKEKVMILGGGPNRIGQGIEFDYMCVHAAYALKEIGYETVMVNSNPETVSTDYDTSDKLYFEPVTLEDVLNIYKNEKPLGVIIQLGGQTPLNTAKKLDQMGVSILGTSVSSIDLAEDRDQFKNTLDKLRFKQPANRIVHSIEEAIEAANAISYPVVVRPSYVLGGRAMEIVYDDTALKKYMKFAVDISDGQAILIDKFLEDSIEVDVDVVADGKESVIAGIMEHIEEAGVHSGDSACVLPTVTLNENLLSQIREMSHRMAAELGIIGLMNIQLAIKQDTIYFLEVNPRGSRTVPFVSKATGIPWAKIATWVMLGKKLNDIRIEGKTIHQLQLENEENKHVSVKEVVLPFNKFPEEDTILGPEMKSTGEAMGIDHGFGMAFFKSQMAAGVGLPLSGNAIISVTEKAKPKIVSSVKKLVDLGFKIFATEGTHNYLQSFGIATEKVYKVNEGSPDIVDMVKAKKAHLILNTPLGSQSKFDEVSIRQASVRYKVPIITTVPGMIAAVNGIEAMKNQDLDVKSIQNWYKAKSKTF